MASLKIKVESGKLSYFGGSYFGGISEDGKSGYGNGWEFFIRGRKVICHSEREYSDGTAVCHREFPLRNGVIGLSGGYVRSRYAYFRSAEFQAFLSKYGITAVNGKEGPDDTYVVRSQYDGAGTDKYTIWTDGILKEEEREISSVWYNAATYTYSVTGSSWVIVTQDTDVRDNHCYSRILYTRERSFAKLEKSFALHGVPGADYCFSAEEQVAIATEGNLEQKIIIGGKNNLCREAQLILAENAEGKLEDTLLSNPSLCEDVRDVLLSGSYKPERRRELASRTASSAFQKKLAQDDDEDVLLALLGNPSLCKEAELEIASRHVDDDFGEDMLRLGTCCTEAQVILAEHSFHIGNHVRLNREAQVILAEHPNVSVRIALAQLDYLSPEAQVILSEDNNETVRCCLAEQAVMEELLNKFLHDESWLVRQGLAGNKRASSLQGALLKDKDVRVRQRLAHRVEDAELQKALASDPDTDVRSALASRGDNLCREAQIILAKDADSDVRCSLAESSLCPELQAVLVRDASYIRIRLAKNPSLCEEVGKILATDEDEDVRIQLAKNVRIFPVQAMLARDTEKSVRNELINNLHVGSDIQIILAQESENHFCLALCKHLCKEVEVFLAKEADTQVREYLAMKNLYEETQLLLAKDKEISVRETLGWNRYCCEAAQMVLAKDSDKGVRARLSRNSVLCKAARRALAEA